VCLLGTAQFTHFVSDCTLLLYFLIFWWSQVILITPISESPALQTYTITEKNITWSNVDTIFTELKRCGVSLYCHWNLKMFPRNILAHSLGNSGLSSFSKWSRDRRIVVQGQQKLVKLYFENKLRFEVVAKVIEHLPSKYVTLSSSPSTAKTKSWVWWCIPIISTTREAEVRGSRAKTWAHIWKTNWQQKDWGVWLICLAIVRL
jgi:hypothetical protein